ncbi:MAG: hypothetical protein C5B49_02435 [Bdellovibrio sp.]|nr:MAG: hypothetical protein C5B49_02435 [Bdellovibrio sp.]
MDVRNVLGSILPVNLFRKDPVERAIKSDSATDRDANGQMPQGEAQDRHPPMSEEQFKKAMEHLRGHSIIREHNLTVEGVQVEDRNFVLIKEPDGRIVRRITEQELWSLLSVGDNEKGQLLRRTA